MTKKMLIIAGPNGAGKTSAALTLLSNCDSVNIFEFINADEIAKSLAPLHPESMALTASKLMVRRLRDLLEAGNNFAFETTGAGTNYLKYIKQGLASGYEINIVYLWLASPELAVKRVAQRVAEGGHHIPEEIIRRRYFLGLKNVIHEYLPLAHIALLLDNSSKSQKIIAQKRMRKQIEIVNRDIWDEMQRLTDD